MPEEVIRCRLNVLHSDFILQNHRVHNVSVMPGVTFVDIILRILGTRGVDTTRAVLSDVLFTEPVAGTEDLDRQVEVTIKSGDGQGRDIIVVSRPVRAGNPAGDWRQNLTARLSFAEPAPLPQLKVEAMKAAASRIRDMAEVYEQARREGIVHGPPMRCAGQLYYGSHGLLAELELDPSVQPHENRFYMHPAKLDAATLIAFAQTPILDAPFIPISLAAARSWGPLLGRCYIHVPETEQVAISGDVMHNDYRIYDCQGRIAAEFARLTCKKVRFPRLITALVDEHIKTDKKEAISHGTIEPEHMPVPVMEDAVIRLKDHLRSLVASKLGIEPGQVSMDQGFYDQGLDSMAMLSISRELEPVVGAPLYPTLLFEFRNIETIAQHLAKTYPNPLQQLSQQPPIDPGAGNALPASLQVFRQIWRPYPLPGTRLEHRNLTLLLLEENPGSDVAESFRGIGYRVAVIGPGRKPATIFAGQQYRCDPLSTAQLISVFDSLAAGGHELRTFVVLAATNSQSAGDAYAHDVVRALATAILQRRPTEAVRICFVAAGENGHVLPEYAAMGALARTIAAETPILCCRSVAIYDDVKSDDLAALIHHELAPGSEETEVRYSCGRREVPGLESLIVNDMRPVPLKKHGVYLLAGGGGGLGRRVAGYLAQRYKANLLLVGRSPSAPELTGRMAEWRKRGAQVEYLCADITKIGDVRSAVAHAKFLYKRLDGIFHLAGEIHDGAFFLKDRSRAQAVIAPKLRGAINLDLATQDGPLEVFVLFSSLSSVLANPGQSDYAYANASLDHFAVWRKKTRPGVTVALDWPYWAEGGMRLDEEILVRERLNTGLEPLPTPSGLEALAGLLGAGEPHVVVAYGDEARLSRVLRIKSDPLPPSRLRGALVRANPPQPVPRQATDIAVIGMAGKYAQAHDLSTFWQILAAGRNAITEIPRDRWDHRPFFDPVRGKQGKTYGRWGGFIEGVDLFAPGFFSISRRDAERMDPQERLFLQAAWHAFEDAGYLPEALAGERVGVFAGVMWNHYQLLDGDDGVAPLALHSSVPNRVSYCFGLTGPSIAVDTACSSSLVAIHLAVQSIRNGDSTMALAGGVNLSVHPQKYLQLAQDQFLSSDGRCRAFGSGGTGYVPGEGVGVMVLKPLARAIADGDHVDAVIKGSWVNHSGKTSGYTVPDPAAQGELIREAIQRSGVPPAAISYIEAHGTGTALGDPIEIEGLRKAFAGAHLSAGSCAIGSVKSNIGHLESAAGIAGLTKVILQMRYREIVPSIHAEELNPQIDFKSSPFFVQRQRTPWRPRENGGPLRAGISAFGAGGTNAHVIVESAEPASAVRKHAISGEQLIVLSAPDMKALSRVSQALLDHLVRKAAGDGGLFAALRSTVAGLIGVSINDADPDASFFDLGLDALGLAAIARALAERGAGTDALPGPNSTIRSLSGNFGDAVEVTLPALQDAAFTLQLGRRALDARMALVVADMDGLRAGLRRFLDTGHLDGNGYAGQVSGEAKLDPECADLFREGQLREVAQRWVAGAAVDWAACYPPPGDPARPRRVSLPGTPLPEERCWIGAWKSGRIQPAQAVEQSGPPVELQVVGPNIAVVTMRDDKNHNMFTDEMLRLLEESFARIHSLPDIKVVVLTGTERVFCMGGSPAALEALAAKREIFTDAVFVYEGLLRCQHPVIAAIQGHASGGGLAFGLYAEIVVMSREGGYSANFLKYGFTPGMGASHILEHRFGAALAAEMLLTGATYRGDELERRGAQVLFEDPGQVLPRALNLARSVAEMPLDALTVLKTELAGRMLKRLPEIIAAEVAMHGRVLGEEALARVHRQFGKSDLKPAVTPAGHGAVVYNGAATAANGKAGSSKSNETVVRADLNETGLAGEREEIIATIEATLCALLYVEACEIDRDRSFSDMGVDSIGAVEIVRDLNRRFDTALDSIAVYDHPTVRELAGKLLQIRSEQRALRKAITISTPEQELVKQTPLLVSSDEEQSLTAATPAAGEARRQVRISLSPILGSEQRRSAERLPIQPGNAQPIDSDDIAVIGMSGRFPDAPDLGAFWRNLAAGTRSIREIPSSRWNVSEVFSPNVKAESKTYSRWAAMLTDVDCFDHRFFNLSPMEAQTMDPQQRLFLMEAWKALEDAGYAGRSGEGKRCAVFVGCAPGDYAQLLEKAGRLDSGQAFLGNSGSILAARAAYFLDFHGPTVAVDTACSSSLVAVHLACQSLRAHESDLALAGGVALMLTPSLQVRSSRVGMLSPTGTSAPFSSGADGIVLGEGVGVVVLKRAADAVRDGDRICGLVKASGMNGDGKTNGITAPSANAQAALLRSVHGKAGIPARDISYVEAHGTGTALGDPVEFKALVQVFSDANNALNFCGLGSVKGNIGHTTMAAGIAGLLKVLLALEHRQLPPTPGYVRPNPEINFAGSPFYMVETLRDWMPNSAGRRIAAVSSFGFSGTNCHIVVAGPPLEAGQPTGAVSSRRSELVPLSARSNVELDAHLRNVAGALVPQHQLADIAFTLSMGRRHLPVRAAIIAEDTNDLRTKLLAMASGMMPAKCRRGIADEILREAAPIAMNDLESAAAAYVAGGELDWAALFRGQAVHRVSLPPYPFVSSRHWIATGPETPVSSIRPEIALAPELPVTSQPAASSGEVRVLDPTQPLLADHKVGGEHILAGAASIEFVITEAQRQGCKLPVQLGHIRWMRPLVVEGPLLLDVVLRKTASNFSYKVGTGEQPHCIGTLDEINQDGNGDRVDLEAVFAVCSRQQDLTSLYDMFAASGLEYGPSFRLLREVAVGPNQAIATIVQINAAEATVPAALLDAAFQAIAGLVGDDDRTLLLPVGVRSLDVYAPLQTLVHAIIWSRSKHLYDLDLTDGVGKVLARVKGLALRPADRLSHKIFLPVWHAITAPAAVTSERTAIIYRSSAKEFADALNRSLSGTAVFMLPYGDQRDPDLSFLQQPYDTVYLLAPAGPHAGAPEQDSSASVLLQLVKALIANGREHNPLTLKVVLDGAVATAPDEAIRPHTAALIGLARTVAAEYPGWRVSCVDTGIDAGDLDEIASRVADEDAVERLVALRGERRLVRVFQPATLPALQTSPFRRHGVYLLLGGAGGIGFALSEHLARMWQARLAWIGRRPADAEIQKRMAAIAAAGGKAIYLQADATDRLGMAAAVSEAKQQLGQINGVIHTAAVFQDRLLRNMNASDLEHVLAAKVSGAVNLHHALAAEPLDFLGFFSSAAALMDSGGQGNYAAANTFMDAYAAYLRRAGIPVTLINWGYWGSVGAVANGYHRRLLAAEGIGSIEPEMGFHAVERALAAGVEQVLVIEAKPAGLAHFGIGPGPAAKIDRSLGGIAADESLPTLEPSHPEKRQPGLPQISHSGAVTYLQRILAEVLKFQEQELDAHSTFDQFGVDSVVSVAVVARLERDLGPLPSTLLFEEMTLDLLAKRLIQDRGAELLAVLAPSMPGPPIAKPELPAPFAGEPAQRASGEDIAVIGVTGRYPGAPNLECLWRNLAAGGSSISEVPGHRWDWRRYADARQGPQSYLRWGGFIDGVDMFDAAFFGILPRDAVNIDPQERLFLEACWDLLEQTGYHGLSHEPDTGVFAGLMYGTYGEMAAQLWQQGELSGGHSAYWSVANRVSYTFDLHGPSFAVDSACSSSLTAVHLACESIRRGDCRMAIAGGVNLILHPAHLASLGARNMLAPDGKAKVFDAGANGYVPGEGVGAVLLKPLPDALADGDDIWAVIKGSALNAGGKTSGYTVPNPKAQADLVETALRRANIDPRTITYIEAHGTGTELGDPIEISGLTRAFAVKERAGFCSIGSIKSNIGHLEGAAGIAGLTKLLLQIRNRKLAPTVNLASLNPKIESLNASFKPQRELAQWPQLRLDLGEGALTWPRRAGVSSFGAGGANVHVIVEEWLGTQPARAVPEQPSDQEHLFLLSAPTQEQLLAYAEAVAVFLSSAPPELRLENLAFSSQVGRQALKKRLAVIARSLLAVAEALRAFTRREETVGLIQTNHTERAGSGVESATSGAQLPEQQDLRSLARRWTQGEAVDWRLLWSAASPRRASFPGLPLDRKRYWINAPAHSKQLLSTVDSTTGRAGGGTMVERQARLEFERTAWEPASLGKQFRSVRMALLAVEDPVLRSAIARALIQRGISHLIAEGEGKQLVEQLAGRDSLPDAVIHIGAGHVHSAGVYPEIGNAFHTVLQLAVNILARQPKQGLRLLCARVERDGQEQPHLAALAAVIKTLAQEHCGCTGSCLALALSPPDTLAMQIVDELCGGEEFEAAYRHGLRMSKKAVAFTPPAPATNYVARDGMYLITGGAGALGLHFAGLLVERGAGEIVLIGRSGLGDGIATRIADLGRGANIRYEQADVASQKEIDALVGKLRRGNKPVRGVIHAAGVIRDAAAVHKTREQIDAVLAPKLAGTLALDHATAADPLDFFVLFSSVVGWSGNRGQVDYAYSNCFLDAFAETREHWRAEGFRSGKTLSIGWPLWRNGGMKVDDAVVKFLEQRWGMTPMTTESGLLAFESLLAGADASASVIEKVAGSALSTAAALRDSFVGENPSSTQGTQSPTAAFDIRPIITAKLCELAAGFLLVDTSEVDIHAPLLELGFDSISMSEMVAAINKAYGLELLPAVLFECPDLEKLVEYIACRHGAVVEGRVHPAPEKQGIVPAVSSAIKPEPTSLGSKSIHTTAAGGESDIAVIGMAGLLPGSANLEEFWRHLAAGDNLIGPVPADREELIRDRQTRNLRGGFIEGVAEFDAELFGIAPREAALMDPQQRLFLQAAWSAIADAGYKATDFEGTQTGVFAGVSTSDYNDLMTSKGIVMEAHMATGLAHAILANRVSHLFGLQGPSETVDTACSSSLVAVHHAVRALRSGECETAIAGGVSVLLTPGLFVAFTKSGMLSPDGLCKTFDNDANGYVRGEGAGVVILKRLDCALLDGDHIYALIKGSAVNHCGRAASLTAPNPRAQAELLKAAYADGGIAASTISYLEAHGTGTRLGDLVEIEGLRAVFGAGEAASLILGSVKTNIGHLEAAAGIAGLLKVLLAVFHGQLPPHLHLRKINSHIKLQGSPFVIHDQLRPWPSLPVRRAGVSSFGFGGTNAHVVIEDPPVVEQHSGLKGPLVLVVSAPDAHRLATYARSLADRLASDSRLDLSSVAYSLQTGREEFSERLAVVADDPRDVITALRAGAQNQAAAGLYRGVAAFSAPWLPTRDDHKLASLWVQGAKIDWLSLWSGKPRRTSLPTFPLAKTRHWFAASANGLPAAKELAQSPGLLPLGAAGMSVQTDRPAVVGGGPDLGGIIRAELAEILHIHATEIAADHTFQKLGLDSIFAMDLAEKLSATLGREVQAALLYEYNTIELLTGFLGQAGKAGAETSGGAATAAAPLPDASASPAKAEAIQRTATEVLAAVLAKVVGRPLNLQHSFTENGFSSLDMLRAVNKLEEDTGALPKTLLFDQPDIASLTDYLCAKYGVDTVLKLESLEQESDVAKRTAPLPVTQLANNGPSILAKHLVQEDASLSRVIGDLARVYGVESGFAGRDIAPLLFLSASRRGYLEFSQYHNAVLVWSYTGPPQAFVGLVEEFAIYARSRELQINVLSPTRIEEIAGGPSTTTPFGVVQQIENLDEFSLHGQKMGRLRGMVHRFTRSGQCAVREYASGSDPAVDQQIVSLIDRWAARKSEVSPYISSLREDLRQGRIAPEHRVFLTTVAGVLRAAVIITRMASEPGYLLDTEFYGDDMPMGGLEYTIVQIIHVLRAEGIKVFSFGATFGIKVCDSPNTSPEAEQALQELRSVGVLGTGNYRFKNKFRPQELPIYLCQPADGKTDVSVVLLMIAGAYEAPQAAKSQPEQPALPSSAATNRDGLLETVHWNPLRLAHSEIEMDLLTDSWAERTDTWIMDRIRLLAALHSKPATTAETINEWWLPFVLALPTPSGRSAEALLCRAWPGRRGRVLHNGLFPTWDLNLAEQRFTPVALPGLDQGESSFSPDVCVHALKNALAERKNPLSFIVFELSNNASGGHPVRLAQLRRVRELAEVHDVPLVLDASRILENAVALTEIEPEQKGRDPWMVVRELLSLADAATFSLSKDFGVSFGGLVTSRRAELNERLLEQVELRGTDVSLSSRRILQTVLSDHSGVLEQVRQRMATVRTLWQRLSDGGLPVTQPVGGHCVLLDIAAMPAFTGFSHPVASCLAWLYRHTGIRGGPHLAARAAYPTLQHCIRLAVPIGMIAEAAEQAAGSLVQLFQNGPEPEDLRLITDPSRGPKAAGYRPKERVMAAMDARRENWLAQQLQELGATFMSDCYTPSNQNLDVIREIAPNVDCRLVTVPEGEVEVFTIGTGPTLLLMHPFNIGAGVYAPQMAGLSGRFRLIVIHQPGVGRTRVRGNLSLEGIVNLQRRVLFAMGINEPIHVAGSSVGAIFAQYYALRFPERTVSLSIIGGSYRFANRKGQIDRLEQVIVEDFDLVVLGTREARIAKDRERLTRLLLRCESMDPRTGLHYLELFAKEPELTQRLREISVPTLILQGRYDSVVGHVTGRFLHKTIPGSRYLELPQSGHFICFTDPDAVNRALDAFLQEVGHTAAGRQQTEDPRGTHEEFLRSTAMARQE